MTRESARKTDRITADRRRVLLGAGALAGASALGWSGAADAQAKGRIVVGTWGGDYARLLTKNIEQPLLIKQGFEVVQDQAGDSQRRSKMLAEKRLPRGTTDVQGLSAVNMFQMHDAGVIDAIDYARMASESTLILDTRDVMRGYVSSGAKNIIGF